jgi:carboxyl-terminal processing protease
MIKPFRKFIVIGAAVIIGLGGTAFVADQYFEISKNLDIFSTVYKEVNTYYVDEIEPGKLIRSGIDGMLNSLDPYTNFYSEAEIEDARFLTTGEYGGIGASVSQHGDYIMITDCYEGSPAQKEDLRSGDVVLEIDGKTTKGKNSNEISKLLKGQAGTEVQLKINRDEEILIKKLKREDIKLKNVPYFGMVSEDIGYIKQTGFTNDAGKEVRDALEALKKDHNLKGVILDLRGNPGGLLHEAVNVVNCFVDRGQLVVNTRGKAKEMDREYRTLNAGTDLDIPLTVLTNRGSASASEIVAGTIQDLDRGVIVGQRSFGKGLVQNTRPLTYNTQIKITTQKYYTPSGRCIQALDYSHRNEDGSVGKVPDSLTHEFKTKAGRVVKDGGGIKPDMEVEPAKQSNIAASLYNKNIIFEYANKYRNSHQSIPAAKDFRFTEADWQDFIKFIANKEYQYETETEKELELLKKKAEDEKYYDAIKGTYEDMKKKLSHDKTADLEKAKPEIIELLELEISKRYYFQTATIESAFDDDKDIKAAIELLRDPVKYKALLGSSR